MNEKNLINILLVEDDEDTRYAFKITLLDHPKYKLYGETASQRQGLELLKKDRVDVLILDLEIEEGTGMGLCEEMRKLPIQQPFVVVTTNNCSAAILQYLRTELKVDFIFQKINASYSPTQVLSIIDKVYKYHRQDAPVMSEKMERTQKMIYHELSQIGFTSAHLGTDYLASALLYLSIRPQESVQMSKVIYPLLGDKYHTSPQNIEKAMRTAIEYVWDNTNLMNLHKHYPYPVKSSNHRPSNGEFIQQMREKLFG